MRSSIIKNERLFFILGIAFIFLAWFVLSASVQNAIAMPKIPETISALGDLLSKGTTYLIIAQTILRIFGTILIAFTIAIVLVIFSSLSKRFAAFINPLISLFKTMPVAVIILFLLFVFGGSKAPFFVAILVVMPIMYEATYNGVKNIDKTLIEEVRMFSNINFYVVRKIFLPLAFPYALLSILQSIGLGLKVMVMAELIAQTKNSIGYEMAYYKSFLSMEYVFAWGIIMVLFVIVVEVLIKKVKLKNFS